MADLNELKPQQGLNVAPVPQFPDLSGLGRAIMQIPTKPELDKKIAIGTMKEEFRGEVIQNLAPAYDSRTADKFFSNEETFYAAEYSQAVNDAAASGEYGALEKIKKEDYTDWMDSTWQQGADKLMSEYLARVDPQFQPELYEELKKVLNDKAEEMIPIRNAALTLYTQQRAERGRQIALSDGQYYQAGMIARDLEDAGLSNSIKATTDFNEAARMSDEQGVRIRFNTAMGNLSEIVQAENELTRLWNEEDKKSGGEGLKADVKIYDEMERFFSTPDKETGKTLETQMVEDLMASYDTRGIKDSAGNFDKDLMEAAGIDPKRDDLQDVHDFLTSGLDENGLRKAVKDQMEYWRDNMASMEALDEHDSQNLADQYERFAWTFAKEVNLAGTPDFSGGRKLFDQILDEVASGKLFMEDARPALQLLRAELGDAPGQDDTSKNASLTEADRIYSLWMRRGFEMEGYLDELNNATVKNAAGENVRLDPSVFKTYFNAGSFLTADNENRAFLESYAKDPEADFALIAGLSSEFYTEHGKDVTLQDSKDWQIDATNQINAALVDREVKDKAFLRRGTTYEDALALGLPGTPETAADFYAQYYDLNDSFLLREELGRALFNDEGLMVAALQDSPEGFGRSEAMARVNLSKAFAGRDGSIIGGFSGIDGRVVGLVPYTAATPGSYTVEGGLKVESMVGFFDMYRHEVGREGDPLMSYGGEYVLFEEPTLNGGYNLRLGKMVTEENGDKIVRPWDDDFAPRFGPQVYDAFKTGEIPKPPGWNQSMEELFIHTLYANDDPDNPMSVKQLFAAYGAAGTPKPFSPTALLPVTPDRDEDFDASTGLVGAKPLPSGAPAGFPEPENFNVEQTWGRLQSEGVRARDMPNAIADHIADTYLVIMEEGVYFTTKEEFLEHLNQIEDLSSQQRQRIQDTIVRFKF